jgi:hypothetical protein
VCLEQITEGQLNHAMHKANSRKITIKHTWQHGRDTTQRILPCTVCSMPWLHRPAR